LINTGVKFDLSVSKDRNMEHFYFILERCGLGHRGEGAGAGGPPGRRRGGGAWAASPAPAPIWTGS